MATSKAISLLYLVLAITLVSRAITIEMEDIVKDDSRVNTTDIIKDDSRMNHTDIIKDDSRVNDTDIIQDDSRVNDTDIIKYDTLRVNHAWGCSPKHPQFCNKTEANPYTKVQNLRD
ncbi:unnamed protein product [Thlaspi arvense]|uniref:Uncharacterized protein n=1 Tax=Thlaspi arvense TaxID=13288 RepID=A0AAU9S4F9_THLAR|nr:unnamed protein product [Thlaspi arvense]